MLPSTALLAARLVEYSDDAVTVLLRARLLLGIGVGVGVGVGPDVGVGVGVGVGPEVGVGPPPLYSYAPISMATPLVVLLS